MAKLGTKDGRTKIMDAVFKTMYKPRLKIIRASINTVKASTDDMSGSHDRHICSTQKTRLPQYVEEARELWTRGYYLYVREQRANTKSAWEEEETLASPGIAWNRRHSMATAVRSCGLAIYNVQTPPSHRMCGAYIARRRTRLPQNGQRSSVVWTPFDCKPNSGGRGKIAGARG